MQKINNSPIWMHDFRKNDDTNIIVALEFSVLFSRMREELPPRISRSLKREPEQKKYGTCPIVFWKETKDELYKKEMSRTHDQNVPHTKNIETKKLSESNNILTTSYTSKDEIEDFNEIGCVENEPLFTAIWLIELDDSLLKEKTKIPVFVSKARFGPNGFRPEKIEDNYLTDKNKDSYLYNFFNENKFHRVLESQTYFKKEINKHLNQRIDQIKNLNKLIVKNKYSEVSITESDKHKPMCFILDCLDNKEISNLLAQHDVSIDDNIIDKLLSFLSQDLKKRFNILSQELCICNFSELAFYKDYFLYRLAELKGSSNHTHVIGPKLETLKTLTMNNKFGSKQSHEKHAIILDGNSSNIHALNKHLNEQGKLEINRDTAHDYLRFFCTWVHGDGGAFTIVDSSNDLNWIKSQGEFANAIAEAAYCTNIETPKDDDYTSIKAAALVGYDKALYHANFKIYTSGMISLEDDVPLFTEMPYSPFTVDKDGKILSSNNNDSES